MSVNVNKKASIVKQGGLQGYYSQHEIFMHIYANGQHIYVTNAGFNFCVLCSLALVWELALKKIKLLNESASRSTG